MPLKTSLGHIETHFDDLIRQICSIFPLKKKIQFYLKKLKVDQKNLTDRKTIF